MSQNRSLSLFDLIRDPDTTVGDLTGFPDDDNAEYAREYGIGIDYHSKFIEVCVRYRSGKSNQRTQTRFSTNWDDLVAAHDWCIKVLRTKADPVPDLSGPLHCLMESTANYHTPVCMAWGGDPTIINPTIAGATKRKTDVSGSRLPALHGQINIWRECFIPGEDVKALRVMMTSVTDASAMRPLLAAGSTASSPVSALPSDVTAVSSMTRRYAPSWRTRYPTTPA